MPDPEPLVAAHLAAFVAAVDAASVHGAADALGLTASAVTKRVQALETRTGATLFERGRFGLRTTPAGQALYPEAVAALAALRRAESVLEAHERRAATFLTLAASHTIGEFLLPAWLTEFQREHAHVRARVDVINSPAVLAAVRDGRADIGFVEGLDALDDVEAMVVARDEIVAVVAGTHRWARRRKLRARDLAGEPYLTREAGSGTRAVAAAALTGAGLTIVPALEVASTQSVKRALASGGFSLLSALAVADEVAAGTLRALPVGDLALTRELTAVRTRASRHRGDADRFWAWLR